jgi:hypothetical protein
MPERELTIDLDLLLFADKQKHGPLNAADAQKLINVAGQG